MSSAYQKKASPAPRRSERSTFSPPFEPCSYRELKRLLFCATLFSLEALVIELKFRDQRRPNPLSSYALDPPACLARPLQSTPPLLPTPSNRESIANHTPSLVHPPRKRPSPRLASSWLASRFGSPPAHHISSHHIHRTAPPPPATPHPSATNSGCLLPIQNHVCLTVLHWASVSSYTLDSPFFGLALSGLPHQPPPSCLSAVCAVACSFLPSYLHPRPFHPWSPSSVCLLSHRQIPTIRW